MNKTHKHLPQQRRLRGRPGGLGPRHWGCATDCSPNSLRREVFSTGVKNWTFFLSRDKLCSLSHSSWLWGLSRSLPGGARSSCPLMGLSSSPSERLASPPTRVPASSWALPHPHLSLGRGEATQRLCKETDPSPSLRHPSWNPSHTRLKFSAEGCTPRSGTIP